MSGDTPWTPGPWEFGKERRWLFRDNLKADGKFSSSTVLKIDDDAFRPSEADARLIEAAPEMAEALDKAEELLAFLVEDPGEMSSVSMFNICVSKKAIEDGQEIVAELRALLAKIGGEA